MELIIPVKSIKHASSLLAGIANIKSQLTWPQIRIQADKKNVRFSASSHEMSAKVVMEGAKIKDEGDSLVNASTLNGFVSRLYVDNNKVSSDPILLRHNKGRLELRTKTHYKQGDVISHVLRLEEVDPDTFPDFLPIDESSFMPIDGLFFKEAFDKTTYAVSSDDNVASVLKGVNVKSDGSSFKVIATDGKELSQYKRDISLPVFNEVVSGAYIASLSRHIDPCSQAFFYFNKGKMYARTGNLDMIGSLFMDKFPDVDRILALKGYRHFIVNKGVFHDSVLSTMPTADAKSSRISIEISSGILSVKGESSDEAVNKGTKVYEFDGDFRFDCNGWYLNRSMAKIESDGVKILFRKSEDPLIIREHGEQPFDLTCLVVPMRRL